MPTTQPLSNPPSTRDEGACLCLQPGERVTARALGRIEFRAGDGPMIRLAPDSVLEIERAPMSMVVRWHEGGHPMNAAIPLVQFEQFVSAGLIAVAQ
ncbi:MAG: hypothetical protein LBP52_05760 [Burkholderiaceae bacterium]|jgi:hypothetical protein|nr:hypothetical protein [Burkholderiaceae bacterium]